MVFGLSLRSIRFQNECAAISAPRLVPHPNCSFPKKNPEYLHAIRLSVLLMAIGLNLPSIFMRAISFAPKKKSLRSSGILPFPLRLVSLASNFKKLSPALPFNLLTRSLKTLGNTLSGHAADLFGEDIIALYRSNSVTKKLSKFSGFGAANLAHRGCLDTNFW